MLLFCYDWKYAMNNCYLDKWKGYCGPTGQLSIFVLKASENSICWAVCLVVLKFVSLFYQFPVPAA